MSPVNHPVAGPVLTFELKDELRHVREALTTASSRTARTLIKNGQLGVTLVGIAPGGGLQPHHAGGPIMIQVVEGEIVFEAQGAQWNLTVGSVMTLQSGITHGVRSASGGIFLLTVVSGEARMDDPQNTGR